MREFSKPLAISLSLIVTAAIYSMTHEGPLAGPINPPSAQTVSYPDEFHTERFVITQEEIEGEEVGWIGDSLDDVGGIFLTKSYLEDIADAPTRLKVGDTILAVWDFEGYEEEIWDSIVAVEILSE